MKSRVSVFVAILTSGFFAMSALADHNSAESLANRVGAVGTLNIMTAEEAAAARAEAEAAAASAASTEVAAGPVDGAGVYNTACAACHGAGIAGAPAVGDAAAWADRIAQGIDTLYTHAVDGFQGAAGIMPPKGGNMALSDEQVHAAVDHMVEASR